MQSRPTTSSPLDQPQEAVPNVLRGAAEPAPAGGSMDQVALARVRTVLAAERTFAAWIRTGLATIGGGLAIDKLIPFNSPARQWVSHLAGQLLIASGCCIFAFAIFNYIRARTTLDPDDPTSAPIFIFAFIAGLLIIIGVLVFWLTI